MKKLNYDEVKTAFEAKGCSVIGIEYKNAKCYIDSTTKIIYICSNGHEHKMTWADWCRGRGCPICSNTVKPTIEYIRDCLQREGYTLLSTEYIDNKSCLEYICSNGHKHHIRWNSWTQGQRCYYCSNKVSYTYEEVRDMFMGEGYTLLSDDYISNKQRLHYICNNGHTHYINLNSWLKGIRCAYCHGNPKLTHAFVESKFKENGYVLLSKYINSGQKLSYQCPEGHIHSITWNDWRDAHRCPSCRNLKRFGEGNPAWNGGTTFDKYCEVWKDKEYKNDIKERDTHKCLNPYCDSVNPNDLVIHHINYDKKDCHFKNLITVCRSCNLKANKDRDWHQSWYQALLHNRYGYNY